MRLLILFILVVTISCNNDSKTKSQTEDSINGMSRNLHGDRMMKKKGDNIETGTDLFKLTERIEPPQPPPPLGFQSPFKSIQEWLFHLCDNNSPEKNISEFYFVLIERPSNPLLTLDGLNTYNLGPGTIERRMDFKPANHKFFALPIDEFGNLTRQQLQERVLNQLLEFVKSAKFPTSFLSRGDSIKTNFSGIIWSR